MIVISSANYKRNTYKQGLECFENKKWSCAIEKLENLNYKDSEDKLRNARYENYIQTANYNLEQKSYQRALSQYKEAFLLNPSNEDIKVKIESLEIIIKEQQKREEIKRKQQEEENRRNAIKAKISSDAIYQIPTKFGEGYDETIKRYGVATINRINKLAPKAAELVAQNPNCTRVMAVDVSDERSSRNSLTFYADCGDIGDIMNIQRFYISEKEINTKIVPKSVKEQSESINNNQYLTMCEAEIKARLNFPSTYKQNNLLSGVYKAPMNTVVTIPFKAKNALNLELKHKGTCYYNGMTLKDIDILEEK
jgi:tetratricopeptide (TPR) repeat protein